MLRQGPDFQFEISEVEIERELTVYANADNRDQTSHPCSLIRASVFCFVCFFSLLFSKLPAVEQFMLNRYIASDIDFTMKQSTVYTVELQWLEQLWDHRKLFETWVVQATEG